MRPAQPRRPWTTGPVEPPPPPRIPLKFIGVADAGREGKLGRVAVLSDGRGVYHGREGEIVEGRYRILKIGVESIDLAYLDGRGPPNHQAHRTINRPDETTDQGLRARARDRSPHRLRSRAAHSAGVKTAPGSPIGTRPSPITGRRSRPTPGKPEYRIALERAMLNASRVHFDTARQLEVERSARCAHCSSTAGRSSTTLATDRPSTRWCSSRRSFAIASRRRVRSPRSRSFANRRGRPVRRRC